MNGENWFLSVVAVCATAITALVVSLRYRAKQRAADRAAKKASTQP